MSYKWPIRLRHFKNVFSEGANFAIFSTDLRALLLCLLHCNFAIFSTDLRGLLLCLLHCNLTQVGFETCWLWSAKKNLPRHPTFKRKNWALLSFKRGYIMAKRVFTYLQVLKPTMNKWVQASKSEDKWSHFCPCHNPFRFFSTLPFNLCSTRCYEGVMIIRLLSLSN